VVGILSTQMLIDAGEFLNQQVEVAHTS